MALSVFISSVQKELADERRAVKAFILGDPLLSRFFTDVFLFEDTPASDRQPDNIYLKEVATRDLYLGLFGNEYGWKNADGKSPTELEFDHATKTGRERLIFVKGDDDKWRAPDMTKLIRKAGAQLTRRRFADAPALLREVYASLVDYLERKGMLQTLPFDDSPCAGSKLKDIDNAAIEDFIETAESKGRLTLKGSRAPKAVLQNFKLMRDDKLTNAAILLFGKDPRRFFSNIQVHCLHFFGTEKRKPIASQQPYEGRIFEVIDQAVEFVLGKLDRPVGTRAQSTQAPGDFEVPRSVITEAVVNAVAHRDYRSNGFVQVIVYADRIEVWNPGELPHGLTPEKLRAPHPPMPRNPLLAEPLYRVKFVEKAGTGTTDMISDCLAAGLPEPTFEQNGAHFVTTIWRDWLTDTVMDELGLNLREKEVIQHIKTRGQIGNKEYQEEFSVSKPTASRHLDALSDKGVLTKVGTTGKGTHYVICRKGLTKGSKDSKGKGSQRAQRAHGERNMET